MLMYRLPSWPRLDRKDFSRFSSGDDDVAFVKFQTHNAGHVALSFGDQCLKPFAFRKEREAVVNELAVFSNEAVAVVDSQSAIITAVAGESSRSCSARCHRQAQW